MRRSLFAAAVLLVASASSVSADPGLTDAVAGAYFPRTADAELHAIAHDRVEEISACADCMTHDAIRPGTAEVLGFNAGHPNPATAIVGSWMESPVHHDILANTTYGRIGCAELVADGEHWFACVLADGPLPAPSPPPPPPAAALAEPLRVQLLPNTAMP